MITIDDIRSINLKITWKLLYLGLKSSKFKISLQEILNYAMSLLKDNDNSDIIGLASSRLDELSFIQIHLKKLATQEDSNYEIEERKLRLIYVIKNTPSCKINYIEGLIELSGIWAFLEFPKDSPFIFQGKNNSITPQEYYTVENFNRLYEKHINWIKMEKGILSKF